MPLRTARRRISPSTKRRYRAIRNFFRKTLGSIASQPDINSSIALNVTNLQHKLGGIEDQINEANHQRLNYSSFESISRRDTESLTPSERNPGNISTSSIRRRTPTKKKAVQRDPKALYDVGGDSRRKSNSSETGESYDDPSDRNSYKSEIMNYDSRVSSHHVRRKSKKHRHNTYGDEFSRSNTTLRKHLVADSYHSLATASTTRYSRPDDYTQKRAPKQSSQQCYTQAPSPVLARTKRRRDKPKHDKSATLPSLQEDNLSRGKANNINDSLDQDFIADIIKRQYKPVTLFGRRESDISQTSTPVCRDEARSAHNDVVADCELCSCCVPGHSPGRACRARATDISDLPSLCDSRLSSSRRRTRAGRRREHVDIYNDSSLYDVVPVKEMTSPKSRRKFAEDHMTHSDYLREVLPSPRSHRPRLNLQAQNYDDESEMVRDKSSRRRRSPHQPVIQEYVDTFAFRSEVSSEESGRNEYIKIQPKPVKTTRNAQVQEDMDPTDGLRTRALVDDNTNTDIIDTLNQTDDNEEKTDKALCEIKDILQNFLIEIKKDSTASQSEHSCEVTNQANGIKQSDEFQRNSPIESSNGLQSNGLFDFSSCGLGQCSLPGMQLGMQPGMPPPGMPLPGMPTPSLLTPGMLTPGMTAPGMLTPGMTAPGLLTPSMTAPGMLTPGMNAPGMPPASMPLTSLPPSSMAPPVIPQSPMPPPYVQPPYLTTNPCCYPLLCSMNGVQNGYLMPNPSFTCQGCGSNSKDCDVRHAGCSPEENIACEANSTKESSETENLIREIYKYVAQNSNTKKQSPKSSQVNSPREAVVKEKILKSRAVGKNHKCPSNHDANVGTPQLLCSSKSCEAVGSQLNSDAFFMHTNASYSDTVLEKLSTETTMQSTTGLDTTDTSEKRTRSKFASVLQTIGLLRRRDKIKRDIIEEISESESTTDLDARRRYPYGQNVTNYMMHDQEYYHSPPSPPRHCQHFSRDQSPRYNYDYSPINSRLSSPCRSPGHMADMYDPYRERERDPSPPGARIHPQASAPPYPHPCDHQCNHNMQPPVPLCLKEIEVKSAGTQSERKMSFFRKLSKKTQPPPTPSVSRDHARKSNFTQTAAKKPGLWNTLQAKATAKYPDVEPFAFTLKAQQAGAADGDKVRKAMIKKLFYKRNPFSPRNLIVRTLLGKDKTSFGLPPSNLLNRPRMFF